MRGLNELNGFCYNKILQNIIKEALRKNDNCSLQNDGLEILIIQHWHLQHQDLSFSNLLSVQRIVKYGSLLFETRTGCIPKIYKGNLQKLNIFIFYHNKTLVWQSGLVKYMREEHQFHIFKMNLGSSEATNVQIIRGGPG